MRIVIEAMNRKVIDLEIMTPVRRASGRAANTVPAPGGHAPVGPDPHSTTASQVEQADDGVHGFGQGMGFGLVIRAEDPGRT